jgi:hypothetical protein
MGTPEPVGENRGDAPGSAGSGGPPDERMRAPGSRIIGRYRLAEQVGAATDHALWNAFDEVLRRPVAMLTFAPGAADVGEVLAAAGTASRVGDVRFAHVFDAADSPEGAYVVTEWPSGECLEDLVAAGRLEVVHAVGIVAEAARALSVAHAAGVVHLRLSPRAVWWSLDGGVKITGLAVDAALASAHSDDGALADTQALAALLCASLTSPAPGGTTPASAPSRGRGVHPHRQVRTRIPRRIDRIISRTLLPGSRRGSPPITHPAGLAAALSDMVIPAALSARSHTGWGRPGTPRRPRLPRLRTAALSGGALTLIAAAGVGGYVSGRAPLLNGGAVTAAASSPSPRRVVVPAMPPPRSPARSPAARLTPLAVRSFGPNGHAADGYGNSSQVWHTHWYTTAHFGNLQTGTGLLLDMGRPVQITGARISLGAVPGADLQVRIAASTSSERAFRTVAGVRNAAGPTDLAVTSSIHGRYVLIWFTRLPPAGGGNGTYQAIIHAVALYGLRA